MEIFDCFEIDQNRLAGALQADVTMMESTSSLYSRSEKDAPMRQSFDSSKVGRLLEGESDSKGSSYAMRDKSFLVRLQQQSDANLVISAGDIIGRDKSF